MSEETPKELWDSDGSKWVKNSSGTYQHSYSGLLGELKFTVEEMNERWGPLFLDQRREEPYRLEPDKEEAMSSEIKVGDKVRINAEGTVLEVSSFGDLKVSHSDGYDVSWFHSRSVEKIKPPVEVFKPGDRVRLKSDSDCEFTLADSGFLAHWSSGQVDWISSPTSIFTSKGFTLVYRPEDTDK